MMRAGQVILIAFPHTDLVHSKLRPALLLAQLPGPYDDWLICMISSQTWHCVDDFDELVHEDSDDFAASGLKAASVIRIGRLAVVERKVMKGATGEISQERMRRIRSRLAEWLTRSASQA
jgi:mRNA interferase MazF